MVMQEISEAILKRRADLVEMLEKKESKLELEKQHQIYGAINELDLFLQTLQHCTQESEEEDQIRLVKPTYSENEDMLSKIVSDIKKKITKNKK